MWDLVKEFAAWVGWFPISLGAILTILLGKHFYEREISIRNQRIEHLKDEIETGKAYQYDEVYERLTKRVKTLNEELVAVESESSSKQEHIDKIKHELDKAYSEVHDLRDKLKYFDKQLGDLLEPDYCQVCDVDDEHVLLNVISWGYDDDTLTGDTFLVEKIGTCLYCGSINVKCNECGSITGFYENSRNSVVECEGGCGTFFTLSSFRYDKSTRYSIKVSQMEEG